MGRSHFSETVFPTDGFFPELSLPRHLRGAGSTSREHRWGAWAGSQAGSTGPGSRAPVRATSRPRARSARRGREPWRGLSEDFAHISWELRVFICHFSNKLITFLGIKEPTSHRRPCAAHTSPSLQPGACSPAPSSWSQWGAELGAGMRGSPGPSCCTGRGGCGGRGAGWK